MPQRRFLLNIRGGFFPVRRLRKEAPAPLKQPGQYGLLLGKAVFFHPDGFLLPLEPGDLALGVVPGIQPDLADGLVMT